MFWQFVLSLKEKRNVVDYHLDTDFKRDIERKKGVNRERDRNRESKRGKQYYKALNI